MKTCLDCRHCTFSKTEKALHFCQALPPTAMQPTQNGNEVTYNCSYPIIPPTPCGMFARRWPWMSKRITD
jgi:hypothetical protein